MMIFLKKYFLFFSCTYFHSLGVFFFKSRYTASVNNAMASNQKTATIKTLRKWEKEFQVKLDFDINTEYKVCCIRCSDCRKWEPRIKEIKNFRQMDQRD